MKYAAIAALAVMGLGVVPSFAGLVVNFDGSVQGSGSLASPVQQKDLELDGDADNLDSRVIRAFTNPGGAAWSTGGGYTGPALYGGFVHETLNKRDIGTAGYALTSSFDLRVQSNGTGTNSEAIVGRQAIAVVFDSAQTGLSFDNTSYLSLTGDNAGGLSRLESVGEIRWLVRNGTTYYVSQTLFSNANAAGRVLDATELASETWAVYNPADAFNFSLSLTFDTATSALTDLNAFGFSAYKSSFTGARHWLNFGEFKADAVPATVIPEPATLGMGVLGMAGLLLTRGRRRR